MSDYIWSIVIPVRNRGDWLALCLTGIKNFTKHSYEIIIVDGRSTDAATLALFERAKKGEFGPCKVVSLAENKSFSNAINSGCSASSGRNFIWLNSDAIPTDDWDKHLYQDIQDRKVGIAGCRSNAVAGLQGDSTGISAVMDPPYLAFVAVALRREVYEQVGPMPEDLYTGFSCEDISYSWRVKKSGGRLKVSNAYVLHGLSKSLVNEVGYGEKLQKNNDKYGAVLIEEWGQDFVIDNTRLRPRVMLCSFSAEEMTRVAFAQTLMGLRRGTAFDLDFCAFTRLPIHIARQSAVDSVLNINKSLRDKGDIPFSHICMLDDDASGIPPDAIMRMLAHKKDFVSAIAYQRGEPYLPCVYEMSEDQEHVVPVEIEHTGLRKIAASGLHFALMTVSMFERLREHPVEQARAKGIEDKQELQRIREKSKKFFGAFERIGEDLRLHERMREAGIQAWADTDLCVGHIGAAQVVTEATRKAYKQGGTK